MHPWLQRLSDADDRHTQHRFSADARIQTMLALERAASTPPGRDSTRYPALYIAMQNIWGAPAALSGAHEPADSALRQHRRISRSRSASGRAARSSSRDVPDSAIPFGRTSAQGRSSEGGEATPSALPRRPSLTQPQVQNSLLPLRATSQRSTCPAASSRCKASQCCCVFLQLLHAAVCLAIWTTGRKAVFHQGRWCRRPHFGARRSRARLRPRQHLAHHLQHLQLPLSAQSPNQDRRRHNWPQAPRTIQQTI